jgi:hypothetical protein
MFHLFLPVPSDVTNLIAREGLACLVLSMIASILPGIVTSLKVSVSDIHSLMVPIVLARNTRKVRSHQPKARSHKLKSMLKRRLITK